MDREQWLRLYEAQSPTVQDYLLDTLSGENESAAQSALAYDHDAWNRVMDTVWTLLFLKTSQKEFQEQLKRLSGDRKPEEVEKTLLFRVVLPLADLVDWDVEGRLQELGTPMGQIQSIQRVSLRPVSYGAAVRRIAAEAKLSILSEETIRRAREILISYIKGVRTVEQVKEMLMRSQAEGGVGFAKPQADAFAEAMASFLSSTQVLSENEYAAWLTSNQQTQREAALPPSKQPTEGDQEVLDSAATMPQTSKDASGALETAVQATLQAIGPMKLDDYLQKRLENAVSTRLRDVRNPMQIKSLLERDPKVGGLGLEAAEADRIAGLIEATYQTYRSQITEEEKSNIATLGADQKLKMEERRKRESEEHAQWFQDKVQANQKQAQAKTQALLSLKEMAEAKKQGRQPTQVPLADQPLRPSMEGVVPPTQLVGLAEELGGMTMAEFRRLARDPEQAAEKILQKLDTLQQESFEQWTEGVLAWRRSPLQQTYLKLVAESFATGKPVAQLAQEKRLVDPLMPSTEELGAIIEMNSHIQL